MDEQELYDKIFIGNTGKEGNEYRNGTIIFELRKKDLLKIPFSNIYDFRLYMNLWRADEYIEFNNGAIRSEEVIAVYYLLNEDADIELPDWRNEDE